ncbi:type II toxin-antitoxin system RelE/ParE family toxin [Methyloraptor flagellatus]|jgi:plasmid stabilization system protein ParE|uniref:Type II toxin-antitoxin system RelE/ParE family toxin n=1 Tax=Methyloraptor flagellatus TaxID=3162530 RepID=A0AAU7X8I1_9HYPH
MRIVFSRPAKRDLDDLRVHLGSISPRGLANVAAALERRILNLGDEPMSGRATPHPLVREVVEPRYGFVIPYTIRDEALYILRIYSTRRQPLDYDEIELP